MPENKILFLLAESRSGSNWLTETLNRHPDLTLLKEMLAPGNKKKFLERIDCGSFDSDMKYIQTVLESLHSDTSKFIGFKILFPQAIRFMDFYNFIETYQKESFIVLTRDNSLRAEVSGYIARTYQCWHQRVPANKVSTVYIDPNDLYKRLEWRRLAKDHILGMLAAYNVKILRLTYESLFNEPNESLNQLSAFLDIEDDFFYSDEEKSNPYSLEEMISNYEDVYRYFERYPFYSKMLS